MQKEVDRRGSFALNLLALRNDVRLWDCKRHDDNRFIENRPAGQSGAEQRQRSGGEPRRRAGARPGRSALLATVFYAHWASRAVDPKQLLSHLGIPSSHRSHVLSSQTHLEERSLTTLHQARKNEC